MFNGLLCGSEIPARESTLPSFLDWRFGFALQEKRTDKRHKGLRDQQSGKQGRCEAIFVPVANAIVLNSLVGPSHAAVDLGWPSPSSRAIASPETTGTSTSNPRAMISEAIETCCRSIPRVLMTPNVIASVIGIDAAISRAVRQLQKPISATMTTSTSASIKLWLKSSILSCTCRGWSEVLAKTRSAGNDFLTLSRFASTSLPKELICSPFLICTESVIARVVIQLPFSSRRVNRFRNEAGLSYPLSISTTSRK